MNNMKQCLIAVLATVILSIGMVTSLRADEPNGNMFLYKIMEYTHGILEKVDKLPDYLNTIATLAINWLAPDDTGSTATMQLYFSKFSKVLVDDFRQQGSADWQKKLNTDLFGGTLPQPALLPEANDITYSTLLGQPIFSKDPRNQNGSPPVDNAYNYIKNASGLGVPHLVPLNTWQGSKIAQARYKNYYMALTAIESFDSDALSTLYMGAKQGNVLTTLQAGLIAQASSSDWFAQIATEKIGLVLRQLLMYQSQLFVMTTKLLDVQNKMLTAQVMNNTLAILSNQNSEQLMTQQATGAPISI